jgi:hypothetical protein
MYGDWVGLQLQALVDTGSEYTWIPTKTLEKIGVDRKKKLVAAGPIPAA